MRFKYKIVLLARDLGWGGGVDFLRYLANGFCAMQSQLDLSLYIFLPVENKIETIKDVARVVKRSIKKSISHRRLTLAVPTPNYHYSLLDSNTQIKGNTEVVEYSNTKDGLLRALNKVKADVVLPIRSSLGKDFPVPWIGYLPDFQYKYIPENFSASEISDADYGFSLTLKDAKVVIVNSESTLSDIYKFMGNVNASIFSLPFSPNPSPEWLSKLAENIREKYKLPEHYFLISNQFWVHKDHLTAFKALKCIVSKNVGLVCTGSLDDYRKPDYIGSLQNYLKDNNMSHRIKLLGHIPKRDQIEIMKMSVALIQPTLFEGGPGGGCVYDSVSLGVPAIVSDIAVNKEVVGTNIYFFQAGDYIDLAEKMNYILGKARTLPDTAELIKNGQLNLEKLGRRLIEVVNHAISS